eukprot:EG_transcript_56
MTPTPLCRPLSPCLPEADPLSPLHSFQLRNCSRAPAVGYQLALSRAPSSNPTLVTGILCLFLEVNHTLLVLAVPHRQGTARDPESCSPYCDGTPAACKFFDLTGQGRNATFQFEGTTFRLTSGPSLRCGSTDLYTLSGGAVEWISVPTFTDDPICAPGTDASYGRKNFVCSGNVTADWPAAQAAAQGLGGQLATLRTSYEFQRLSGVCCAATLARDGGLLWIGGRRDPLDNSWQWQPGHLAEGLYWNNFGSPQQGPPGNCLALGSDLRWYGTDCGVPHPYLMEVPAGPAGLVSFRGPAEVCLTAPEAAGLGCLWRYVLHNDDLYSHRFAVVSSAEFLNITFNGVQQSYLDLEPCQAVEVCVGLSSAPEGSQTVTLQFVVDTVVRDTRTVAIDLLPTPIIGTSTDPGTATTCDIYQSSSSPNLELRASEPDPSNLFVSMTAVDANDTSRVYGSTNTRRLLLSSGVWQGASEVDLLVVVKYRLASNTSATCSKTRRCALHIVPAPLGAGYFSIDGVATTDVTSTDRVATFDVVASIDGVAPGGTLNPGQTYTAHIFGFVGANLKYSMWGYCSQNPNALFQLSAASGNPQASILVPPYNYGCALVLRAQAEDSTGAVAVSAGVPYDVNSTAPAAQVVALRNILGGSLNTVDDVLKVLCGLSLLPGAAAAPLLPAFVTNLTAFTRGLADPVAFLEAVAPSLYSHVLYLTGAPNTYFISLSRWFAALTRGRTLPADVAGDVARVTNALMQRISAMATSGGGVIGVAAKFVVLESSPDYQAALTALREVLTTSVLPSVVLAKQQQVNCESGGETSADRCFAVCALTDTLAGHLSRGAISVRGVADPAGKRVVSWRNLNRQWLSESVAALLPQLVSIGSVEIYSKCNPLAASQGFGDPLTKFAVLDGATGNASALPVAANALYIPILNATFQSCYQLNENTSAFATQLGTSGLSCRASGFVWVAAGNGPTKRDAADNSTTCGPSSTGPNLAWIIPIAVLSGVLLLCCGALAWLFLPPRDVMLRFCGVFCHITWRKEGELPADAPTDLAHPLPVGQRPGDSPTSRRSSSVGYDEGVDGILAPDRAKEAEEPWAMGTPASLASPRQSRQSPGESHQSPLRARVTVTHAEGIPLPPKWDGAAALGHGLTLAAPPSEPDTSAEPLVQPPEMLLRRASRAELGMPPLTPLMMSLVSPDAGAGEALMMDPSPAETPSGSPRPGLPPTAHHTAASSGDKSPTSPVDLLTHPADDCPSTFHLQSPIPPATPAGSPDHLRRRSLELGAFLPDAADDLLAADTDAGSLAGDGCDPLDVMSPMPAMSMPRNPLTPARPARPRRPEDPLSPPAGSTQGAPLP